MVEGYPHPLCEVFAEDGDLGVTLAEVVQHNEVGIHLHPDADGLRRRAVVKQRHKQKTGESIKTLKGCSS